MPIEDHRLFLYQPDNSAQVLCLSKYGLQTQGNEIDQLEMNLKAIDDPFNKMMEIHSDSVESEEDKDEDGPYVHKPYKLVMSKGGSKEIPYLPIHHADSLIKTEHSLKPNSDEEDQLKKWLDDLNVHFLNIKIVLE